MSYRLTTDKTWSATDNDLSDCFRKWGVSKWDVETPLPPRSRMKQYQTVAECIVILSTHATAYRSGSSWISRRVLYLAVEAMRMNDQRGLTDVVRQAYAQLPAPVEQSTYVTIGACHEWSLEQVEAAYKAKARQVHPDSGGTVTAFQELNVAMEQVRKERQREY